MPLPSATSWGRGSHQNALRRPFTFHARIHRPKQIARCWYRSTALRRLRSHKGRELFPQMTGPNCSLNRCFAVRGKKKGKMAFGSLNATPRYRRRPDRETSNLTARWCRTHGHPFRLESGTAQLILQILLHWSKIAVLVRRRHSH